MIHRPDRCNPDLDDRLLQPNEARAASNLRMAASIDSTNLGITTVNGMALLEYEAPSGDNQIVGIREDYETQYVYFALFNNDSGTHDHGIWRTNGLTVDRILHGSILNFQEDGDVSIAIIDGKIYLTDNVNQPRMCNIQKGIDGDYPDPLEEWMITQIKRPPGLYLETTVDKGSGYVSTEFTLADASIDYNNEFPNESGFQFAYYYVYDNDEESRLSPVTPVNWWTTLLKIRIPQDEFDAYLNDINLVKYVVFCFRIGNDGIWYEIKRIENIPGNYVNDGGGNPGLQYLIPNVTILPKTAVSSDITDADFDSVPLLAATLEVAQNRLDLGNYLIDYANWDGLTLELVVENVAISTGSNDQWRTFMPGELYNVGIELLDEWGRKIGVVNQQVIQIPKTNYLALNIEYTGFTNADVYDNFVWDKDSLYHVNFTVSGTFPDWCKSYRIVYSKALTVTQFNKSVVKAYQWYSKDGVDYLGYENIFGNEDGYFLKGTVLELTSGEPFLFNSQAKQYVDFVPLYYRDGVLGTVSQVVQPVRFPIAKQNGPFVYIANLDALSTYFPFSGSASPLYYPVDFIEIGSASELFYQSTAILDPSVLTGTVTGDCYLSFFKKINNGSTINVVKWFFVDGQYEADPNGSWSTGTGEMTGYFISENPTNIYSQVWSSDIGAPNVVNENQRQKRILQGIVFSNPLIQGTQINGLSKFNSIDNRQAPLENGPITALVRTTAQQNQPGVLLAIGVLGVSSFYFGATQLTNADGTSNVTTTDAYLASQNPLLGLYGAAKGRNIVRTPKGNVYWWSEIVNDWIRYSQAGLDRIGQTFSFSNQLRQVLSGNESVVGVYDQVTDDAILIGRNNPSFVFSERYKTNQPVRDYFIEEGGITPERAAGLAQRTIFFLQGQIWVQGPEVGATANSFFGEDKSPTLTLVTNEFPDKVKRWGAIKVYGPQPTGDTQLNSASSDMGVTLQTRIPETWWQQRKGAFVSRIAGREDVSDLFAGKPMECRILYSTFAFSPTMTKINYIEILSRLTAIQG